MNENKVALSGLIYIKHGDVGTRSEGPRYHLQTSIRDANDLLLEFELLYEKREKWELDYHLEFYNRKMVNIKGQQVDALKPQVIHVEEIVDIISTELPPFSPESILPGQDAT